MAQKLGELEQHKGMPLILPDRANAAVPEVWDTDVNVLRMYELSLYVPKMKNTPLSTQGLTDFILKHYRPTNMAQDARRVWEYIPGS